MHQNDPVPLDDDSMAQYMSQDESMNEDEYYTSQDESMNEDDMTENQYECAINSVIA